MKNQKGFSLLEVILVLMIIYLLIGVMIPVVLSKINEAERVSSRIQVERIYGGVLDFNNDLGLWPNYVNGQQAPGGDTYNILRSTQGSAPASLDPKWLETAKADFIENQMVTNQPGYNERTGASPHGWNGPYLRDLLAPDPWGNKYYINNVDLLDEKEIPSEKHKVWILSAGPNETIDTPYTQLQTTGQLAGDDIGLAIIH